MSVQPERKIDEPQHNVVELPRTGAPTQPPESEHGSPNKVVIAGIAIILLAFVGMGIWAATAPLDSAAMAPGTVAVESNRKVIEHLDGGIVDRINVRDGQQVERGQLLVKLDATEAQANYDAVRQRLDSALARRARLMAERAEQPTISFPAELTERRGDSASVGEAIMGERVHFQARRRALEGQLALQEQKVAELREEIAGLKAQQDSTRTQVRLLEEELVGLRQLNEKGFFPKTELLAKEREMASLQGDIGSKQAGMARANERISEVRMQVQQIREDFNEKVVRDLRETEDEISELRQRLIVNKQKLDRTTITAPRTGTIQELAVHTEGEVIKPGEEIMQIVPSGDRMVVDAEISPTDIDTVSRGQGAEVRLTSYSSRVTPVLQGRVVTISADRIVKERENRAYYKARVEIPGEELAKLGERQLQAGMPAEVLIKTGERTMLDYLTKPLTDAMARGLIEK
ncbi:HlyD family type I secretion periplasmic adaptor subunit [Ferruginivarius sediminum]|uniref:Membrane fusion protein (MFP) family protein n=1 Tax=Ferruginivarius sediminum TaxID=2661937 RepID=A0A369TH76_9PROT|nr:HlyD family type I secretion periplasmic adaptor subunit [Ferruginivarius sediminum]RDD62266.1 HlyD family type I secretion periplasmic adaptor subunit [Ferruginivarius sediminum]